MLSESQRTVYASAVESLKKRFRPIDIEELRGHEFKQQGVSLGFRPAEDVALQCSYSDTSIVWSTPTNYCGN